MDEIESKRIRNLQGKILHEIINLHTPTMEITNLETNGTWVQYSYPDYYCAECEVEFPCETRIIFSTHYVTEWDEINEEYTLRIL